MKSLRFGNSESGISQAEMRESEPFQQFVGVESDQPATST
jgi:hypothetical protein